MGLSGGWRSAFGTPAHTFTHSLVRRFSRPPHNISGAPRESSRSQRSSCIKVEADPAGGCSSSSFFMQRPLPQLHPLNLRCHRLSGAFSSAAWASRAHLCCRPHRPRHQERDSSWP